MKMHVLYYRRLHGTSWSPYLVQNEHSAGATGVIAIDSRAEELEIMRIEIADSMELDSVQQLKWFEVEPK